MTKAATLCFLSVLAFSQRRPTNPQPTNLGFSEGEIGQMPRGWDMPQFALDAGYRAELRRQDCGVRFATCVIFVPPLLSKTRAARRSNIHFRQNPISENQSALAPGSGWKGLAEAAMFTSACVWITQTARSTC